MSTSSGLQLVEFSERQAKPNNQEIAIAITSDGLRFSSGLVRAFNLHKKKGVVLYADPSKKVVAFRFHDQLNLKAHPEMRGLHLRYGGFVIRARAFFVHFGLDIRRLLGRYTPVKDRHKKLGEIFIVRLHGQTHATKKRAESARRVSARGSDKRHAVRAARKSVRQPTATKAAASGVA